MRIWFLFFILFFGFSFVASASPLANFSGNFTEGFETGTFTTNGWGSSGGTNGNWVVSTTNPRTGTYHAQGSNTDAESVLITNISTVGYQNINFNFWYETVGIDAGEYIRVDWYNGTDWINVLDITDAAVTYSFANFSLPDSAENNSDFAIRFKCLNSVFFEYCRVDDIQILGEEALGIDLLDIYLLNQDGNRLSALNNTAAETSDVMIMNLSVNHVDTIDTWYLNYSANGTNGCALGNKQSSYCYSYPEWIQFINGTETETFDALKESFSDYIHSFLSGSESSNFSFIIDEHYNPNVFKWYGVDYNFSDEKWLNDSEFRIGSNGLIKVEINSSIIPMDMDFARIDLRVSYNGTPEKLEMHVCNSSLTNQDPHFYAGCNLIGESSYSELYENGTKFKAYFTKNSIDEIGDLKYVILHSESVNFQDYYYIKTYAFNNENSSNHWEYSNDLGSTWNKSDLMYDTQLNINWFYANSDSNKTAFVYRFFANTTSGYEKYLEGNLTWEISAVNNYPPLVVISNPNPLTYINQPYNVTFSISDTNDDDLNITLALYKNGSLNKTLFNGIDKDLEIYYWNETVSDNEYQLVLEVCEVNTTELYCRNNTRNITVDNTLPVINSVYPMAGSDFDDIPFLNLSANISELNLDFVYVNVTYPNSSIVRFNMTNFSLGEYNASIELNGAGNYSLDFFSEDLAGNVVTASSNFSLSDTRAPSVEVLYPLGQNFSSRDDIEFVLNLSDFSEIEEIFANLTYPNSTIESISDFSDCLGSDSFSENTIGSQWDDVSESISSGQNCTMNINGTSEGKMYVLINGSGFNGITYCGFNSFNRIYGDFDMSLKFNATVLQEDSLFVFRSSNIETFSPTGERVYLLLSKSGSNIVYRLGYPHNGTINETTIVVNETFGDFRIKKINSTTSPVFNLFYLNGSSWINPLGNIFLNDSKQTQYVQMYTVSSSPGYGSIEVFIDDFEISEHNHQIYNAGPYSTEGVYNVSFFVNDSSGNINNTEKTNFSIFIINHAPSRPFIFEPDSGSYYSGVINIDWLEVVDEENDTLQYNLSLLNPNDSFNSTIVSNYGNNSITNYFWNSSLVSDGEYNIEIKVFENDTVEKYSSTDTMGGTFFIDNTGPSIEIISSYYSGGKIYFNVNSSDLNFDNVTVFLYSGSSLFGTMNSSLEDYSSSFSVGNGNYYLNATAYDLAGNSVNSERYNFIVLQTISGSSSSGGSTGFNPIYLGNLTKKTNKEAHKGQKIYFSVKNVSHVFEVLNLSDDSVFVSVFSNHFQKRIFVGEVWKLDFDNDSVYDLKIQLDSILSNRASFSFENLSEFKIPDDFFLTMILEEYNLGKSNELIVYLECKNSVERLPPIDLLFEIFNNNEERIYSKDKDINCNFSENQTYFFPELNMAPGDYILVLSYFDSKEQIKIIQNFQITELDSIGITGRIIGGAKNNFSFFVIGIILALFLSFFILKYIRWRKSGKKREVLKKIGGLSFEEIRKEFKEANKI